MKRLLALIFVLLLLVGCGTQTDVPQTAPETVQETDSPVSENGNIAFGSFTAQTLTGETVTDAYFSQADLTIVNIWATYCSPCIKEMPLLGKLHDEMENVQVLGIVLDCIKQDGTADPAQVEVALDIANTTGATYPIAILNLDLIMLGAASVQYTPTTVFIDRNGNFVGGANVGPMGENGLQQAIAERLEMIGK